MVATAAEEIKKSLSSANESSVSSNSSKSSNLQKKKIELIKEIRKTEV